MLDGIKKKIADVKLKGQMAAARQLMKKQGVSEAQQDMIFAVMEKNPQLFEKIAKEIELKKKEGKGEMAASMEVMRKYQGELQKMFTKKS
jgi:hypothetical protein